MACAVRLVARPVLEQDLDQAGIESGSPIAAKACAASPAPTKFRPAEGLFRARRP
jgi:hypothetical protein